MRLTRKELVAAKLGLLDRIECMYGEGDALKPFNSALAKVNARIREIDSANAARK